MLKSLANIQIKSTIKSFDNGKIKQFIPWQNIQKIALIVNQSQQINKSLIDKFIGKHQKYFEVFFIEINSKVATYADWHCFIKTDLNLLKLPKKTLLQKLSDQKFDLVINASEENDTVAQSISAAIHASFKCGSYENFDQNNLVIKRNNNLDMISHLEEIVRYLKMIKN